jgi:hypothetical protein
MQELQFLLEQSRNRIYQDVWIEGKRYMQGARECVYRYQILREFFSQFRRPVKVLDIGANMGYFSIRLAEEFPGCFVLCEASGPEEHCLRKLLQINQTHNALLVRKPITCADIVHWAQVEHFDVILALSVIHHFDEPYSMVLDALTKLGSHLIVEVPRPGEGLYQGKRVDAEPLDFTRYKSHLMTRTCYTHSRDDGEATLRDMWLIDCGNHIISRRHYGSSDLRPHSALTVCDFQQSRYYYPSLGATVDVPCALQLPSFLWLGGSYPSMGEVYRELKTRKDVDDPKAMYWDTYLKGSQVISQELPGPISVDYQQCWQKFYTLFEPAPETANLA